VFENTTYLSTEKNTSVCMNNI